jgi:lipopolysaccharide transport system permease protein
VTSQLAASPALPRGQLQTGRRYAFDVCTHLISREFRTRYRRSVFGWLWSIAQPLFRFLVLGIVFGKLLKNNTPHFASFLFSGLVFWQWFSSGVGSATRSVMDRTDLLLRPGLPRWTIPLTSVLTDGIDLMAALPVLLIVLLVDGRSLSFWLLLLPGVLLVQLLLILGAGMLLCAGNVYFRDVGFLVDIMLLMGFYVTPVFYQASTIPQRWRWIVDWNPVSGILRSERDVVLYGRMPDWTSLSRVALFAVGVFAVGSYVYNRTSGRFVDEL